MQSNETTNASEDDAPTALPATILLVEDDPGDQELTRRGLRNALHTVDLRVVSDGEEALEYLKRCGRYENADAPRPDLVLLDLNMPKVDGKQVLAAVRAEPSLRTLPMVVMTTSDQERDVIASYELGANSYIRKPFGLKEFSRVLRSLEEYWLDTVMLPHTTIS